MPDDRLITRSLGFSDQIVQLDDLGFRIFIQYILSADDFGVMVFSAAAIKSGNLKLSRVPDPGILQRLAAFVESGLLLTYTVNKFPYLCSPTWQNYQKVRYPRKSSLHPPPAEILEKCSAETAEFFRENFRKVSKRGSEPPTGLRLTANGNGLEGGSGETTVPVRRPVTGSGPMAGELHREHLRCANPCGRVCMTPAKFDEFVRKYGGPRVEAERYVRDWKHRVDDEWDQERGSRGRDQVESKPWEFWDARWMESHPAAPQKSAKELRAEAVRRELLGERA